MGSRLYLSKKFTVNILAMVSSSPHTLPIPRLCCTRHYLSTRRFSWKAHRVRYSTLTLVPILTSLHPRPCQLTPLAEQDCLHARLTTLLVSTKPTSLVLAVAQCLPNFLTSSAENSVDAVMNTARTQVASVAAVGLMP